MRAMELRQPGPVGNAPLVPVERPLPSPPPGELLLKVTASAACRTDLQLAEGDVTAHRLPVVPGHQVVGRVEAVGDGVRGWSVGDRAGAIWLAGSCGHCQYCLSGRENLCPEATFTGWDRDGGFADALTVRADFAVRLPAGFSDEAAAPLLCGGVIGFRALRLAGVPGTGGDWELAAAPRLAGEPFRLGLYGFGASASLAIQAAVHLGCQVHVASRSPADLDRARELGAASVGGYADPPPATLHAAVTFAPVGSVVIDALRTLAPGGTVVINAIHLDQIPEFDYDLLWQERGLRSVANVTRRDAEDFLRLAAQIPIRTTSHLYPLLAANRALTDLAAGRIGAGAAVLDTSSD
jgi:propanol-preferring alcohol dehydrogenase